jgi:acyl-CoA thioester hydrolase
MFSFPIRVYWEDTVAGGVVYHANYVKFFERARSEWLRSLGIGQRELATRQDTVFAIRSVQMDFLAPARLDDELIVTVELTGKGRASLDFRQQLQREPDGQILVRAQVRAACLSASTFRPRAMPDGVFNNKNLAPRLP